MDLLLDCEYYNNLKVLIFHYLRSLLKFQILFKFLISLIFIPWLRKNIISLVIDVIRYFLSTFSISYRLANVERGATHHFRRIVQVGVMERTMKMSHWRRARKEKMKIWKSMSKRKKRIIQEIQIQYSKLMKIGQLQVSFTHLSSNF